MDKGRMTRVPAKKIALLLLLTFITAFGISGCGSQSASTQQTQSQSGKDPAANSQSGQGQGRMQMNPATRAAMEVIQLQRNQQAALSSDQISKIKPVLQELMNTSNPTDDFLQKEAAVITGVFTDQQKSLLAQRPERNNSNNNNNSNNGGYNQAPPNGTNPPDRNQPGNREPFSVQDIYQQALDALK
ncbi:MAG: hypothetical protein AWM53_01458 [Candidatus Dichloromethanomonas elyunquensis]|nr:MAG: hypothetical protein AWM53_01458 [Candidatus Dichloromethanomonas elyunquensis]